MSHCHITGFFNTHQRLHVTQYRPAASTIFSTPSTALVRFAHYTCPIRANGSLLAFAIIRAVEPLNNDALPPNAVVFAVGTVFVQSRARPSIVESDHFHVIPGDPSSPAYRESIPKFNTPRLDAIGTLCGRRIILSDNSKIFFTSITQFVRDGIKTFVVA